MSDHDEPRRHPTSRDHEQSASVSPAVVLSIVGADLVPDSVYDRAKVLQEDVLKAGPVPYSNREYSDLVAGVPEPMSDQGPHPFVRTHLSIGSPQQKV